MVKAGETSANFHIKPGPEESEDSKDNEDSEAARTTRKMRIMAAKLTRKTRLGKASRDSISVSVRLQALGKLLSVA